MEIKISNKTEQPLLSRTVLTGIISFDAATPSRFDVRKKLSEALKSDESLIAITKIATDFGSRSADVTVHVYKSKEDLSKFEPKTIMNRHLTKEEKEKAKEGKKEEKAPTADKKQEPKKEQEKQEVKQEQKPEKKEEKTATDKKQEKTGDKKGSNDKK